MSQKENSVNNKWKEPQVVGVEMECNSNKEKHNGRHKSTN